MFHLDGCTAEGAKHKSSEKPRLHELLPGEGLAKQNKNECRLWAKWQQVFFLSAAFTWIEMSVILHRSGFQLKCALSRGTYVKTDSKVFGWISFVSIFYNTPGYSFYLYQCWCSRALKHSFYLDCFVCKNTLLVWINRKTQKHGN